VIGLLAFLIGASLAIGLLSAIWHLLFKRFLSGYREAAVSVAASFITACILYAFGSADGGPVNLTAGVLPYGIASILVFCLRVIGIRNKQKQNNG
jgi:hypothetical protein